MISTRTQDLHGKHTYVCITNKLNHTIHIRKIKGKYVRVRGKGYSRLIKYSQLVSISQYDTDFNIYTSSFLGERE